MSNLLLLQALALSMAVQAQKPADVPVTPLPIDNASALAVSASADDILTDPQGEERLYVMNCAIVTEWGDFVYPSLKSEIRFDADSQTVYMHNLFPRYRECWVKGTIEGDEIVIPSEQPIFNDANYGVVYFYASRAGEGGYYNTIDEMRLTMGTDDLGHSTICSADSTVLGGVVKMDKDGAGYLVLNGNYEMEEFNDPFAVLPEGTPTQSYALSFIDYYNHKEQRTVEVAFAGDDVYLQGLIPDADEGTWVKGTIEGDSICIPSMQAAHSSYYLLSFCAGHVAQIGEFGEPVFGNQDFLKLGIDAERRTLTTADGDYSLTIYGNRQALIYAFTDIVYSLYEGDQPAVPAAPVLKGWNDIYVEFDLPMEDVDGNFINPDCITWSAFFDGELYTFNPDEYVMLNEPTTEFKYTFTDSYDIMAYGSDHMFFLYDMLYEVVEIQSYYTVNGVRNASAKASNVVTPVGLIAVEPGTRVAHIEYYDLSGRILSEPKGTCIARLTLDNGEVKTSKIVTR